MKITVIAFVNDEELDRSEVNGYRGAGWFARLLLEGFGLVFRGTFKEYKLPEGDAITFVVIAKEATQ